MAGLRDHSNVSFEVFIASFTVLPILVLIYFYPDLPERVPEYLNLKGDVAVWGPKSLASIFRLPLMAVDMQVLCLLMKYGLWQRRTGRSIPLAEKLTIELLNLSSRLWDWFRALIAFKLGASSLDVIFFASERLRFLTTAVRTISWAAGVLGIMGSGFYGYRLLTVSRRLKHIGGNDKLTEPDHSLHLRAGIFYYNAHDPSLFIKKYLLNFANQWAYVFLVCLVSLPLLMFLPLLMS